MSIATETAKRPMIELHMEADKKGEVTPVIPVVWSFSNDLVDKLAKQEFSNPHVVIVVGYERPVGWSDEFDEFVPIKVYVRRLLDASPKEFIQFSKTGKNIVLAFVVNPITKDNESEIWGWHSRPSRMDFSNKKNQGVYKIRSDDLGDGRFDIASFRHDVIVEKELFAPEPSKLVKSVVRQFFPNSEVDQCDFRRRFLISLALDVPVQIYGIFARLFTLVFALFFAKRGMQFRLLFALNPHDFGHALGGSFWYNKDYWTERNGLIKWLSPPQLVLYVLIVAVVLLPGFLGVVLSHLVLLKKDTHVTPFSFGDVLIRTAIIDPIIITTTGLFFLLFTSKGHHVLKKFLTKIFKTKFATELIEIDPMTTFDLLRKQAQANVDVTPDRVQNRTISLKYQNLKMKVCKPFARITD